VSFDIFQEWRRADRAAAAAERAVLADSLRSIEAMGNSPAVYHLEKAKLRRAIANELFELALEAVAAQGHARAEGQAADLVRRGEIRSCREPESTREGAQSPRVKKPLA
jgi:hypothetical protein